MQHGLKCYKKTYIYIEREERKYCPCKQLVCRKLFRKRRPFNSLYFLCPFGRVEENRALFLVLQSLEKSSQACISVWKTEKTGGHVLILRNHTSKTGRSFVGNALIGVLRKSKKKKRVACDWLFFIQSLDT